MSNGVKKKEAEAKSIPKNKLHYFPELDYLRGLAILAVITIHITTYYTYMPAITNLTIVYMILIVLARYGVPLFLLVSGFALYNKYNKEFDLNEFYIKRLRSIVPPYIIFSVLYEKWNRGAITTAFFNDLLTGKANQHLWFIILIIELYISYPVIMQIYNKCKNHSVPKYFLVVVFFINILYNSYLGAYWFIPQMLGWIFYFVIGMYIRDNYESIDIQTIARKYWLLVVTVICIGTALSVIELENTYFSTSILSNFQNISLFDQSLYIINCTALTAIIFYISMKLYKTKRAKFVSIVGSYSFGIYLIHAYIVVFVAVNLSRIGMTLNNTLFYPCVLIVTLISSITAIVIIEQLPYHEYIIGKTSSEKSLVERSKSNKLGAPSQK
jgi:probable poly-beta-1,6-N-acetyl-D-glucosamine export protein